MTRTLWHYLFVFLLLINAVIWTGVGGYKDTPNLRVIVCDVGQGDGILIIYKNIQIITDAGPNTGKMTACLTRYMPFWDREIEYAIMTNADLDHYGGFFQIFKNYKVDNFLTSQIPDSTQNYQLLESLVGGEHINVVKPNTGMELRYDLMYLDILYPDGDHPEIQKDRQNNLSTVYKLKFGKFTGLFTGDMEKEAISYMADNNLLQDVDFLKVAHHGSRNGTTQELLDLSKPEVAAISNGANNRYGHPHEEVIKMLSDKGIKILRTDQIGDIIIETDSKDYWLAK